jgi:penicillin-binding protein 2
MLEAGAWGAQDAGPIVRRILDAWLVGQGGAPDQPLPAGTDPAATSSVPVEDVPAQASSGAIP